ncbi:hypothetical protein EMCRGX_G026505 [Ephydatia muelleri]
MLAKPKVQKEPVTADMLKAMVEATGPEPPLSEVSRWFTDGSLTSYIAADHEIKEVNGRTCVVRQPSVYGATHQAGDWGTPGRAEQQGSLPNQARKCAGSIMQVAATTLDAGTATCARIVPISTHGRNVQGTTRGQHPSNVAESVLPTGWELVARSSTVLTQCIIQ